MSKTGPIAWDCTMVTSQWIACEFCTKKSTKGLREWRTSKEGKIDLLYAQPSLRGTNIVHCTTSISILVYKLMYLYRELFRPILINLFVHLLIYQIIFTVIIFFSLGSGTPWVRGEGDGVPSHPIPPPSLQPSGRGLFLFSVIGIKLSRKLE